jgi:hypothetical protein
MPNNLFGRIAEIVLFPEGDSAIVIGDDLRFEFTCKKSPSSDANTADISVSNLSQDTRDRLDEQIGTPLILSAGYSEGDGLMNTFFGDVVSVKHRVTPPTVTTVLTVGDGAKALRDSKTSLSFKKNTQVSVVIKELTRGLGKPIKNPEAIEEQSNVFLSGYTAIGNNKTLLDQLARNNGFSWSIQNDEIVIVSDSDTPPADILVLSPETGLVGVPERINDSIDKKESQVPVSTTTTGEDKKRPGWNVEAKLFPEVVPGDFIALQFRARPEGEIVKIIEVEHSGDTYGEAWTTKLQVQDI